MLSTGHGGESGAESAVCGNILVEYLGNLVDNLVLSVRSMAVLGWYIPNLV